MDTFEPRRITQKSKHDDSDRLKHIAGLIQKLTFREMNELAILIAEDVVTDTYERVPDGLLKVADRILAK